MHTRAGPASDAVLRASDSLRPMDSNRPTRNLPVLGVVQ